MGAGKQRKNGQPCCVNAANDTTQKPQPWSTHSNITEQLKALQRDKFRCFEIIASEQLKINVFEFTPCQSMSEITSVHYNNMFT